ncbi:MAG: hypothetical protein BECKG1743F_GA0114225_111852, partial [Candidatus Kentron sp. G]
MSSYRECRKKPDNFSIIGLFGNFSIDIIRFPGNFSIDPIDNILVILAEKSYLIFRVIQDGCNPSSAQAKQPMVLTLNRHWRQYQ